MWGNGRLSSRWEGGFKSRMDYFYVSDIGVLGAIFLYGCVLFTFLLIQFPMGLRCGWRLKDQSSEPYTLSLLSLWVLTSILCIGGGFLVTFPGVWMIAFGLLMMECMLPSVNVSDSVVERG